MGGGGKGGKQWVTEYAMSMHLGICAGPVDSLNEVYVGDKKVGVAAGSSPREIVIRKRNLYGGVKKEGGIEGLLTWLPGKANQLMTSFLASKYNKTPTTMTGYRGIASVFFTGNKNKNGFYWSANSPYLREVAVNVTRIPRHWYRSKAAIPNSDVLSRRSIMIAIDRSTTMGATSLATVKTAVNNALDTIDSAIRNYDIDIDVNIMFWSSDRYKIDFTHMSASQIPGLRNWVNGIILGGSANYDQAAQGAVQWFDATRADPTIKKRIFVFITGSEPSANSDNTAAATMADIISTSGGNYNSNANTAVECYAINVGLTNTSYAAKLDNTSVDGVPVISSSDSAALSDAISGALFPDIERTDSNPIHIIHECLTNKVWGMGGNVNQIDDANFRAAADTLYAEKFGISIMWRRESEIADFISEILAHVEGMLFINPRTGLINIKLIRADYDQSTLPIFDKTNCDILDYQMRLPGEMVSEVVVKWTNPENEQTETYTLQDPALASVQGIVSKPLDFYGIRKKRLAQRVCERNLRAMTAPLSSASISVSKRSAWNLNPGDVIKLVFPDRLNYTKVMRIMSIDRGDSKSADVTLNLIEDVFATPEIAFQEVGNTEWEDSTEDARSMDYTTVITLPYYLSARWVDESVRASATYPEVAAGVMGAQEGIDTASFEINTLQLDTLGNLFWQDSGTRSTLSRATLGRALDCEAQSSLSIADVAGMTQGSGPVSGGFALIGGNGNGDEPFAAPVTLYGTTSSSTTISTPQTFTLDVDNVRYVMLRRATSTNRTVLSEIEVMSDGVNVALGAKVTPNPRDGTLTTDDYADEYLVDGDNASSWASGAGSNSTSFTNQWVQIDLGGYYPINSITLKPLAANIDRINNTSIYVCAKDMRKWAGTGGTFAGASTPVPTIVDYSSSTDASTEIALISGYGEPFPVNLYGTTSATAIATPQTFTVAQTGIRYVMLRRQANDLFDIADVTVMSGGVNVAQNKNVAFNLSHDTADGSDAAYAVDGAANTFWASGVRSANAWIQIDLGQPYNIDSITLTPRVSQSSRMRLVSVYTSAADMSSWAYSVLTYAGATTALPTLYEALSTSPNNAIVLERGVFDTVPRAWPDGTPIWFFDNTTVFDDETVRLADELANFKLLPQTSSGMLDTDAAPIYSDRLTARPHLPNRPGRVQVRGNGGFNGIPVDTRGGQAITLTWANRNRTTEDSMVIKWNDANIAGESGQTISVEVRDVMGEFVNYLSGITGTSRTLTLAEIGNNNIVDLTVRAMRTDATAGTLESLQGYTIRVLTKSGYGLSYGYKYGDA